MWRDEDEILLREVPDESMGRLTEMDPYNAPPTSGQISSSKQAHFTARRVATTRTTSYTSWNIGRWGWRRRPKRTPKRPPKANAFLANQSQLEPKRPPLKFGFSNISHIKESGENRKMVAKSLTVFALNVDGLREPGRSLALAVYAARMKADILIITETHLRSKEARALRVEGYEITSEHSREPDLPKMCGGVAILARIGITCVEMKEAPQLALPLNSSAEMVHLHDDDMEALKITGVYLPPKGDMKMSKLSALTNDASSAQLKGQRIGHLLGGDFNRPSWPKGFREWVGTSGLWELSNPAAPIFRSGNSLDKFFFLTGDSVPLAFLPSGLAMEDVSETPECRELHDPTVAPREKIIGNHHAILLDIPIWTGTISAASASTEGRNANRRSVE